MGKHQGTGPWRTMSPADGAGQQNDAIDDAEIETLEKACSAEQQRPNPISFCVDTLLPAICWQLLHFLYPPCWQNENRFSQLVFRTINTRRRL